MCVNLINKIDQIKFEDFVQYFNLNTNWQRYSLYILMCQNILISFCRLNRSVIQENTVSKINVLKFKVNTCIYSIFIVKKNLIHLKLFPNNDVQITQRSTLIY